MSDNNFDDFFGEEIPKVKNAFVKQNLDNPILYEDTEPNLNILLSEYFSKSQLDYIAKFAHQQGARVRIVYCFPFVADEKKMVSSIGKFFVDNVRPDLKSFLAKNAPIVTFGRALYATTFDTDIQVDAFYDSVFNNTFFYSPFVDNRVYPVDNIFRICGFGQKDKKTGEPVYFLDCFETFFARQQISSAIKVSGCSLPRKRSINFVEITDCDEFLISKTENIPANEEWVAVDSETSGFKKLKDSIGNVTLSFDGYTSYYLDWANVNPRIFSKFLNAHKLVFANGKFDLLFFAYHGCDIHKADWDTMIAGHLLNEMRSNSLKAHAFYYTNYGGYDLDLEKYKWKYTGIIDYTKIPKSIRLPYACMDSAITFQVFEKQRKIMSEEPELEKYFLEIAIPMLWVFIKAEYKGFCIDWEAITRTGYELQEKIARCREEVRKAYNEPTLDVNSKQSVGDMLERKGYPCISRGKTGHYKVSKVEFNEWNKLGYKEINTLVEYSKWTALWQTFIGEDLSVESNLEGKELTDSFFKESTEKEKFSNAEKGLWKYKAPDGNVHTTFHPFMASSHRHRSSDPNLQNIPKKNYEATLLVRRAYVTPNTIPCKPAEADKIILLCKQRGYVSLYSGQTITIGEKTILGKDIYKENLDPYGIRVEYEKFYKKDPNEGIESFIEINDSEMGTIILPKFIDSSKIVLSKIWVNRSNSSLLINTKDIQVGDEIDLTKSTLTI
ncbi:MAG: DNA polymerase [Bacteroidales bacterium]